MTRVHRTYQGQVTSPTRGVPQVEGNGLTQAQIDVGKEGGMARAKLRHSALELATVCVCFFGHYVSSHAIALYDTSCQSRHSTTTFVAKSGCGVTATSLRASVKVAEEHNRFGTFGFSTQK